MLINKQVFLAMPMDLVTENEISNSISEFKAILKDLPVDICSAYSPSDKSKAQRRSNIKIVEDGLEMLRKSDILLVDFSKEYDYFGAICEIVYAYQMKIPIIVFLGLKKSENRPWLNYHVKYLPKRKQEIAANIKEILMIK